MAKPDPLARPFYVLAAVVFAVSLLKGLRLPNLWAASHMTFNYSQGFVRRGLFGEALRWIGGGGFQYRGLFFVAVLLLVALSIAVGLMIRRAVRVDEGDHGIKAAALVFGASPGVAFLGHIIGYLDYLGMLIVSIFILWSARSRRRYAIFYVGIPIIVVIALIHEAMVVMFLPVILLTMLCHVVARMRDAPKRARALAAVLTSITAIVGVIAPILICAKGTRSPATIDALRVSIEQRVNFPVRPDAFEALYRPVSENLFRVMPAAFLYHPFHSRYVANGLIASCIGLVTLGAYGMRLIKRCCLTERERTIVTVPFVCAVVTPLGLNFVGWDAARWNAVCFFNAFVCLVAVKLFFGMPATVDSAVDSPMREGPRALTLAAIALVLGLVTNYDVFYTDGRTVQGFPYDQQFRGLVSLCRNGFRSIPDR